MVIQKITALLCIATVVHSAEKCWMCNDVTDVTICRNTTLTCGADEECFLEKIVNNHGETRYNAGCRSHTVCRVMQSLAQGRRSLDPCAQCCTGLNCQDQLCGLGLNTVSTYECLHCDRVSSAHSCTQRIHCQDTEVCSNNLFVDANLLRYSFGCMSKSTCAAFAHNGRSVERDGLLMCSSCCIGDLCNKNDCFTLKQSMTPGMFGP
ncbi:uncharacterized protein LOC117341530 [Pecten maximus]|uniref:uncharacterized protein LOC117341530 n=1 Tax=Pecten maximus TaxID=6579 RepID=UPI001458C585|nr:uncharacterized protein LOC117341530 [Pecten maximus]